MVSKILDIIPPKEKKAKVYLAPSHPRPMKKPFYMRRKVLSPILISLGVILVGAAALIFIEPKIEIDIWLETQEVSFITKAEILGERIQSRETVSREFSASGFEEKSEKAEGIIKVYNNYHLEQILIQNTRFWCYSGDELIEFKTKERVVIPSKGSLDVEVAASAAGESYNIPPCTFSVPGLKGGPRYTAVYGESSSPMSGGLIAAVPKILQEDVELAKEELIEEAFEKSKKSLADLIASENYLLFEGATMQKVVESGSLGEVGQNLQNFTFSVKAEAVALVLKTSELENFAKDYILSQVPQGQEVQEESLQIEYTLDQLDLQNNKISLDLQITANVYSTIATDPLKEIVKNKRPNEIKQIFEYYPEIHRAQVRLWPFWTARAPQKLERISIELRI